MPLSLHPIPDQRSCGAAREPLLAVCEAGTHHPLFGLEEPSFLPAAGNNEIEITAMTGKRPRIRISMQYLLYFGTLSKTALS
jgi:hypothetical protein